MKQVKSHQIICHHCKTRFEAMRWDALYCSGSCRLAAWKKREKLKAWENDPQKHKRMVELQKAIPIAASAIKEIQSRYGVKAAAIALEGINAVVSYGVAQRLKGQQNQPQAAQVTQPASPPESKPAPKRWFGGGNKR